MGFSKYVRSPGGGTPGSESSTPSPPGKKRSSPTRRRRGGRGGGGGGEGGEIVDLMKISTEDNFDQQQQQHHQKHQKQQRYTARNNNHVLFDRGYLGSNSSKHHWRDHRFDCGEVGAAFGGATAYGYGEYGPDGCFYPEEHFSEDPLCIGASVTSQGVISVRLNLGMQVDVTINKGIRVLNHRSHIIAAISPDGTASSLIHPSGKVYAYGSRVEISTTDCNGNSKFAKMFYKGVSFTSDSSALTYLVDQAGTRTTSDNFSDLNGDFSIPVFLADAAYGPTFIRECSNILSQAQYWCSEEAVDNWVINGIRISQTSDGLVRVGRGTSKFQIRTSPMNGTVTLTTPLVHTTASVGVPTPNMSSAGPHLFVKRGERRLHSDGLTFIVRNAGHAAGFDEYNQLKVY